MVEGVHHRMDRHEDACGHHYEEMRRDFSGLSRDMSAGLASVYEKIDAVRDRSTNWWRMALAIIILTEGSLIAYLFDKVVH